MICILSLLHFKHIIGIGVWQLGMRAFPCRFAYDLRPMAPAGLPEDAFMSMHRLFIIQVCVIQLYLQV